MKNVIILIALFVGGVAQSSEMLRAPLLTTEYSSGENLVTSSLVDTKRSLDVTSYDGLSGSPVSGKERKVIFGVNNAISTTREDVWELGGVYAWPSSAIKMRVVSSNANDTAAGTGVQTVTIHYLDENYEEGEETLTMNGVVAVNTTAYILRVNEFHAETVGSGGVAAGNISLQNTGGTVNYSYILANGNRSRQAIYTVPANKTFYVDSWHGSASNVSTSVEVTLRTTSDSSGVRYPGIFLFKDLFVLKDTHADHIFRIPLKVPEKTDMKISCVNASGGAGPLCAGTFDGWLQDN